MGKWTTFGTVCASDKIRQMLKGSVARFSITAVDCVEVTRSPASKVKQKY